jgi:integrase
MARPFGNVRPLGSGRFQARFHLPARAYPEVRQRNYTGPVTFTSEAKARRWLDQQRADIERGIWVPPVRAEDAPRPLLLRDFARTALAERELSKRSREHAESILRQHIDPALGDLPVAEVTPAIVGEWYAKLLRNPDRPVMRSHAYGTLATVMWTAVRHGIVERNPCQIKGAGRVKNGRKLRIPSMDELAVIVAETPEQYRMMIQLAAWRCLRFGEVTELRRSDVDLRTGTLHVQRGVTHTADGPVVGRPKTPAAVRDIPILPHLLDDLRAHLDEHAQPGRDGLLFPSAAGTHQRPSSVQGWWYPAREAAGRGDLHFHDLRHFGATMAAKAGANVRELMTLLGHTSPNMSLRYLQEVDGRQREIADRLSDLARGTSNVIPIDRARKAA